MSAALTENSDGSISLSITFKPGNTMLDCEGELQQVLNEAGSLCTAECLKRLDGDGAPIVVGATV